MLTTSGNFSTSALNQAIAEIGVERVLWSADYPFEDISDAADWFDAVPLSEADRQKIGRTNARETVQAERLEEDIDENSLRSPRLRCCSPARPRPRAEVSEITVAQQFGVSFLPLMLMERDQLIEKHAKAAGDRGEDQLAEGRGPERDQ